MAQWSAQTTADSMARRAGGRRRYHRQRRDARAARRFEIRLLLDRCPFGYGLQAWLSRELGVSEATISRDLAAMRQNYQRRAPVERARLDRAAAQLAQWAEQDRKREQRRQRQQEAAQRAVGRMDWGTL